MVAPHSRGRPLAAVERQRVIVLQRPEHIARASRKWRPRVNSGVGLKPPATRGPISLPAQGALAQRLFRRRDLRREFTAELRAIAPEPRHRSFASNYITRRLRALMKGFPTGSRHCAPRRSEAEASPAPIPNTDWHSLVTSANDSHILMASNRRREPRPLPCAGVASRPERAP